jgi:hypothetical protein
MYYLIQVFMVLKHKITINVNVVIEWLNTILQMVSLINKITQMQLYNCVSNFNEEKGVLNYNNKLQYVKVNPSNLF